jgi:hypothetical protein
VICFHFIALVTSVGRLLTNRKTVGRIRPCNSVFFGNLIPTAVAPHGLRKTSPPLKKISPSNLHHLWTHFIASGLIIRRLSIIKPFSCKNHKRLHNLKMHLSGFWFGRRLNAVRRNSLDLEKSTTELHPIEFTAGMRISTVTRIRPPLSSFSFRYLLLTCLF